LQTGSRLANASIETTVRDTLVEQGHTGCAVTHVPPDTMQKESFTCLYSLPRAPPPGSGIAEQRAEENEETGEPVSPTRAYDGNLTPQQTWMHTPAKRSKKGAWVSPYVLATTESADQSPYSMTGKRLPMHRSVWRSPRTEVSYTSATPRLQKSIREASARHPHPASAIAASRSGLLPTSVKSSRSVTSTPSTTRSTASRHMHTHRATPTRPHTTDSMTFVPLSTPSPNYHTTRDSSTPLPIAPHSAPDTSNRAQRASSTTSPAESANGNVHTAVVASSDSGH